MPLTKPEFNLSQLSRIIKAELAEHPKARYTDIYKLLHQACYGPTHIAPDPVTIAAGIREELAAIKIKSSVSFQDIGCGKGFIRLNLVALTGILNMQGSNRNELYNQVLQESFLKVGAERIELLTQSVLASRLEGQLTLQDWQNTWKSALTVINKYVLPIFTERALIDECLETGKMPSHSEDYRYMYAPHYRVIHHSLYGKFKALKKEKQ